MTAREVLSIIPEARVMGYILGELGYQLERGGDALRPAEIEEYSIRPHRALPKVMRRVLTTASPDDWPIACLMDYLDPDAIDAERTLTLEEQTELMAAYYIYDHEVVTVTQAAEIIGVSRQRVYAMISEGKLTGYRDGSRIVLFRRRVDVWAHGK